LPILEGNTATIRKAYYAQYNFQSKVISVINDMPERSDLTSEDWKSDEEGSIDRIDRELFLLNENENVSHFELLDSEEKQGN
jgi:hypothetical protein